MVPLLKPGKAIKEAKPGRLNYVVGPMISKRAHIGWTTNGHTGEDVVLYVYSPTGDRPTGVIENTDIAKYMERILGLNLQETTKKLFVPAEAAFPARGARVKWNHTNGFPKHLILSILKYHDKGNSSALPSMLNGIPAKGIFHLPA
ncbi:hypothetical protein G7K71_08840 [Desulfofundulus sp. TPOSR]|uniref:alkaline phosphatase n=1 Tax=Desulfofundulus sp. TPOSR TaxID=2714340 RepID=UPI00140D65C9|nr:alkaline phosphatase [Desulfofundulus sp. TPOSR]NHM27090.1 hypothetical protein [Desulfofundulus sp. TPOSR]